MKSIQFVLRLASISLIGASCVAAAHAGTLRAGAAKADITPPPELLPYTQDHPPSMTAPKRSFVGVHDKLWARAIVVDDGTTSAAIVAVDLEQVPKAEEIVRRITEASGIPADRIVIAATHTHNEPLTEPDPEGSKGTPKWNAYFAVIANGAVKAVADAKKALQPARMSYGTAHPVLSENAISVDYPADYTVAVVKLESVTGEPIGILMNCPLESSAAFRSMTRPDGYEISGDIAGIASALVERHFQDKAVVLYTMAAASNMNPLYAGASPTRQDPVTGDSVDYGPGTWAIVEAQAHRLAATVVRVAQAAKTTGAQGRVWGRQAVVTCPGQVVTEGPNGAIAKATAPSPPVDIRLGMVAINDVALAWIDAEVVSYVGQRIQKEGSLSKTIVVTQAADSIGTITADSISQRVGHAPPVKPGCAEAGIVNAFRDLTQMYADGQ